MMKLFLFAIPILFLLSCQHHAPELLPQAPLASLQGVKVKNGRLHFPNQAAYHETELAINSQEAIDLSSWHEQLGFCSMKKLHDQVQEDFAQVNNRASYNAFLRKHQDHLYITADSSISIQGYQPFFSQVLNTQGEVYIGNALVKYTNTHKIRIEDGSEEKLKWALEQLVSNEKNGIWVEKRADVSNSFANSRFCRSRDVWHTIHGHSGVQHRIYAHYHVKNVNHHALTYGVLIGVEKMEYKSYFYVHIKSEYQGFLGYWYRKRTTITWNVGWGVRAKDVVKSPNFAHGTGWTVSNVSEINYAYDIRSAPLLIYWNQQSDNNYQFDYCYSFLQTPVINGTKNC